MPGRRSRQSSSTAGPVHAHSHSVDHEHDAVSRRARRTLTTLAVLLAIATAGGLVALWPSGNVREHAGSLGLVKQVYDAEVVSVRHHACEGTSGAQAVSCAVVRFRLSQGPDRGEVRTIELPKSPTSPKLAAGDHVVLNYLPHALQGFRYTYADHQRRPVLLWLTVLFALTVVLLGRFRGLAALVGLGVGIAVVLEFVLPSMLDGTSPSLVATVGAAAIAYLALYLAHGFRTMTTVALLGTLAALALTVGLATLFSDLADFSGASSEDAILVKLGVQSIDLGGLVLAGMVLGALGALDDITVTQSSAVAELRLANPTMPRRDLYRAGIRIGRDHISSTVNTLALAYAGASLPLLILFSLSGQSLGTVANSEAVAVEIVSALVGSIGLVAAVPLSTAFAALSAMPPVRGDRPLPTMSATPSAPERGPARTAELDPVDPPQDRRSIRESRERERQAPRRRGGRGRDVPDLLQPPDDRDFWRR